MSTIRYEGESNGWPNLLSGIVLGTLIFSIAYGLRYSGAQIPSSCSIKPGTPVYSNLGNVNSEGSAIRHTSDGEEIGSPIALVGGKPDYKNDGFQSMYANYQGGYIPLESITCAEPK